ncbi:MAG TPA: DUF6785 family protein, partial [Chthonomonadaceae bacterium]|nr:DUF6785 family protein [Chthonomonadaceae bacterium]
MENLKGNQHSERESRAMSRFAAGTETQSEATVVPETRAAGGGVRLRALMIGLLMVVLIVGMTQVLSLQHSAAEVGGGAPAPAPTYLLFFYVLLLAPLLSRLHRRLALSRGELLLIYGMMLVAGPITHQYAIGFLIPH